ncbi:MAG: phosphate ABC transporter substrate-binding protein [Candidatus Binatia bacterium]
MSHPKNFFSALQMLLALVVSVPAVAQERVVIDGSTGMLPLATALAKAYQEKYPDSEVDLGKGLGTGARIRALAEGKIQIALASHGLKPEELKKEKLKIIEVAKGAIVFAVNSNVPISTVTEAQICDIYSGKLTDWQAMGGPGAAIAVFTRPPAEVDPEVIRAKVACFKNLKEVETARVMAKGTDMATALAETPYAIGMTSMTVVEQSGGKVKALKLNNLAPNPENVRKGDYYLARDFFFVVKAESTPSVKKFLEFVRSPDGDHVILKNGAVSLR